MARGRIDINFSVEIEATNKCNTRCIHCPREAITRPAEKMSWATFSAVADKIIKFGDITAVNFSGLGEPTLNPLLPKFISYLSADFDTYVTTNGATLTPRFVDKLVGAGLKNIFLSFNGADKATFARMSGGLDFERIKRQTAGLIARAGDRMQVIANVSMTGINEGQAAAIRQTIEGLGVRLSFFSQSHSRGGYLADPGIDMTPPPPTPTKRCDIFTRTVFVSASGDVLACCHDLTGETALGNLALEDIDAVLRRKAAIVTGEGLDFGICEKCNDLYRFMYEPLPGSRMLFEWIYDIHTLDEAGLKRLKGDLHRDRRIREQNGQPANELGLWLEEIINVSISG